ncbi:hypothetical protein BHM03_00050785 [Ensete ventricosum]|nr:hypothetical protein BHM03_00050785 [Ensete ventricosum]
MERKMEEEEELDKGMVGLTLTFGRWLCWSKDPSPALTDSWDQRSLSLTEAVELHQYPNNSCDGTRVNGASFVGWGSAQKDIIAWSREAK